MMYQGLCCVWLLAGDQVELRGGWYVCLLQAAPHVTDMSQKRLQLCCSIEAERLISMFP